MPRAAHQQGRLRGGGSRAARHGRHRRPRRVLQLGGQLRVTGRRRRRVLAREIIKDQLS